MSDESKEIASVVTGLALGDEFFMQQESFGKDDFLPVIHSLIHKCEGKITAPGVYEIKLIISKLK